MTPTSATLRAPALKRTLGTGHLVLFGVGAGVFSSIGQMAACQTGEATPPTSAEPEQ